MERKNTILPNLFELTDLELKSVLYFLAEKYIAEASIGQKELIRVLNDIQRGDEKVWRSVYLALDNQWTSAWGMGTEDAIKCLVDVRRTIALIRGISATIKSLESKGKRDIVAIDAGTGTGILALAMAQHSSVKKVFALEINNQTAGVTSKFIRNLGMDGKIEVIECDATKVNLGDTRADIIVSENLSTGLFDEPQYQIINHLSRFAAPSVAILPHRATNYISLGSSDWNPIDNRDDYTLAARLLPDLQIITPKRPYYELVSAWRMEVPTIKVIVDFVVNSGQRINTLVLGSDFQIDFGEVPVILSNDTAEFLGKSSAIKIDPQVKPVNGIVRVSLEYQVGFKRRETQVQVGGNVVSLAPKTK